MTAHYKNKNLLKNQPFYSSEIKSVKKKNKKFGNIELLSELPFFPKEPKGLRINNCQMYYHPHQKEKEDLKD